MKLVKKIKYSAELEILTGLHIGDSSDNVEIGGIDNPVVRKTIDNVPYIPGSSLKGKIRSLLEQIAGSSEVGGGSKISVNGKQIDYKFEDKPVAIQRINELFGFAPDNKPSKIIFRDSYMSEASIQQLKNSEFTDMPYAEVKFENVIDRVKGTAMHPRQMERIPAGVTFNVEIVVNVWDTDGDGNQLIDLLNKGIKALENDYLGGSGSRGYGQVKFGPLQQTEISFENYLDN